MNPESLHPDYLVLTYSLYLAISVAMTIWVARTLSKNGSVFLADCFRQNLPLADSVNHLLVVGFYLINIGFVALYLKSQADVATSREVFEVLSRKVGIVLLVLGAMHFLNMAIFAKVRRRALLEQLPPPIAPAGRVGFSEV